MHHTQFNTLPGALLGAVGGGFLVVLLAWVMGISPWQWQATNIPMVNGKAGFELLCTNAMKRWKASSRDIVDEGFGKSRKGFYTITENGKEFILGPQYANTIRNDKRFNFYTYRVRTMHPNVPGLDVFDLDEMGKKLLRYVIGHKMTQNLSDLIKPLSEEAGDALEKIWTDSRDWHEVSVKQSVLAITSQQSTRVFLGREFCRDQRWLQITTNVTIFAFQTVEAMRMWPSLLRPVVARLLPVCQKLRAETQKARDIINPLVKQRRREKLKLTQEGKTPEPFLDTLEWAEEFADGQEYDPAVLQLTIALSAMHNTTDFLTQLIYDLAARPELIEELRREIISVKQEYPWNKAAIFNLKLMDSVMKESQRLKPTGIVTMRRGADATIEFPDGLTVQKGDLVIVSTDNHRNPEIYPNPDEFDPYRFCRMIESPDQGKAAHLVSTSENHLGFGHGTWACSGRFFAAAETKVALCHVLIKYDLKLIDDEPPAIVRNGSFTSANPLGTIAIRRRQEEVEL
ncbi:cytochrome P450 [Aspergillus germanicus]